VTTQPSYRRDEGWKLHHAGGAYQPPRALIPASYVSSRAANQKLPVLMQLFYLNQTGKLFPRKLAHLVSAMNSADFTKNSIFQIKY
jgi:hypothetical protein